MIVQTKIQLTSQFLGDNRPDKQGIRRLRRTSDGLVRINETQWRSSLAEAAKQLKIQFDPTTIKFEQGFEPQALALIRRTYNRVNTELFEGIEKDQNIELEYMVDEREGAPTIKQLQQMWTIVGKYLGLSQFGNKFQLGRFKVIHVRETKLEL